MIGVKELIRLNPQAWTSLLAQDAGHGSTVVTAVEREEIGSRAGAFRYLLSLDGYHEPITMIGKKTGVPEALFFANIANQIHDVAPRSWISHLDGSSGWVVHEEPYDNFLQERWSGRDIEQIVQRLVQLHASTWDREQELSQVGFIHMLEGDKAEIGSQLTGMDPRGLLQPLALSGRIASWERGDLILPSDHAISAAGNLGLGLIETAVALDKIVQKGGWPGVFEEKHQQAAAELLDDPMPVIVPLKQVPPTLIHGMPVPQAWHLDLLGSCLLSNWGTVRIGPSIYDLACFAINLGRTADKNGRFKPRKYWPVTEETIVDSYILGMGQYLGSKFSPALTRQAFPAAETLYVLTIGIPEFAVLLDKTIGEDNRQRPKNEIAEKKSPTNSSSKIGELEPYWSNLFTRFLSAYRSL